MFKQKIKLFIFLFFVCIFYNSFSQISVTPTVGCVPLQGVSYSGPTGATGITWNFGDGITSNQATPTHNYTSAGSYTISYAATVGGSQVTYTALVVVHAKPTASFTFTLPTAGCKPLTVPFTSTSSGPAAITNYTWNFGDGGSSSTGPSTSWNYAIQGSFSVSLIVADANGCVSALSSLQGPINVSTPPTVIISSNPLALTSCTAPFTAAFSASNCVSGSPIGSSLTYSWNFGNTQTSTLQTPGNITYNSPGNYNVTLTVTDNNHCSATSVKPVTISQPTLSIAINPTLCLGTPFTYSYQTNQPTTTWTFDSFGPTTYITPTLGATTYTGNYVYNTPGIYTISVSAGSAPCTIAQTQTVFVEQVIANFTNTPPSFTCSPTFTASYINQSSSNATSYTWTATNYNGNSISTSNATNPTFTLVQGSLNPYTIYNVFYSTVKLTASSANGCVSTFTMHVYDSIQRPTAWFNKDKKEGCAPLVVHFRDSSFTNPVFPITSYTWNNGANPATIITGTVPPAIVNPTFTYSSPGTYTPFLIVQTASGCIDISFIDTIHVATPPVINFSVSPSTVCWNQPVIITNLSPTTTPTIQHWHIQSDAGFFSGCINDPNPQWNFTHIGVHTFTMSGYLYSCKGSAVSTQSVTVKGPIAQSRYETNCTAGTRKTIKFFSQLQDVANATLNFGDNSATVSVTGVSGGIATHSVSHTYSASGNYTAILTATNAATGCAPYTYTMLVTVRDIQANFTLAAVGCASVTQTFDASTSTDVFTGCNLRGYVWYFDNLPPLDTISATVNHVFTTTGTHTVLLMVKDENSCIDTTKHTLRISSATPAFAFSSNTICLSTGTVQLLNTTSQTPDPVTFYGWNFGDGSVLTTTNLTSPIHNYLTATSPSQNFTVSLQASNSQGCTDIVNHVITIVNPIATLNSSQYNVCIATNTNNVGTNTITLNAPAAYSSYTFNYGDGSSTLTTTNNITPAHTYNIAGTYTASVTVFVGGCLNTGSVVINAQAFPTPNFSLSTGNVICKDTQIQFTNTSTVTSGYTLNWDLSSGGPIIPLESVVWTYSASGTAVITLTITSTPSQCSSVITKTLNIVGAKANLNLDKQLVCFGSNIHFNIKNDSINVYSWDWDFGDGTTSSYTANASPTPTVNHVYNYYPLPIGNTTVSLIYYSSQKTCSYTAIQAIQIFKPNSDFIRNNEIIKTDSVHCINITDQFSNQITNPTGYTFNWAFGNGSSANTQTTTYTYPAAGVYQVSLTVTDPVNHCTGSTVRNMTITALPSVSILSRDTCQNKPFHLIALPTGGAAPYTYTWMPVTGVNNPNAANTIATAASSTTYTLIIKDAENCENTATTTVNMILPPTIHNWDTTVVVGQIIPLNNNSSNNFTYTWNPTNNLSCIHCPNPISTSTVNITYSVTVADRVGCFAVVNTYTVKVELKGTVDVPTAFTPNGDGTNDIIYVGGWGISKLNYFRVFNRWGQLLFESTDVAIGWDGNFNGVPQNMETYVYQVSAELYVGDGKPVLKTGAFKLIR